MKEALLIIELVGILNILDVIMAMELVYMELIEVEGNRLLDTIVVVMLMMSIEGVDIKSIEDIDILDDGLDDGLGGKVTIVVLLVESVEDISGI